MRYGYCVVDKATGDFVSDVKWTRKDAREVLKWDVDLNLPEVRIERVRVVRCVK